MFKILKIILPLSVALYLLLFFLLWPFYKYIFDTDAVAYLSIAEHYASLNFSAAVNGLWSPLHSWIAVPFIKLGFNTFYIFKISNAFFACGILWLFHRLLIRLAMKPQLIIISMFTVIIINLQYAYFEVGADLLVTFLLLTYIDITAREDFYINKNKNILAGIIGAIAYFAKSYAFPFFIFHYIFLHLWLNKNKIQWQIMLWGLSAFFLLCLPWIYLLHLKYGGWNFSYHLQNGLGWIPDFRSDTYFFPPPHNQATSWWEDPLSVGLNYQNPFQSLWHVLQFGRMILFNFQMWLNMIFKISFLAPAIIFVLFVRSFNTKNFIFRYYVLLFLIFSFGYILLHVELRFFWFFSFCLLFIGVIFLNNALKSSSFNKKQITLSWLIFFGSFLIEPINELKDSIGKQKDVFELSTTLKLKGFNGDFGSNAEMDKCMILAYLNRCRYYAPVPGKSSPLSYLQSAYKSRQSNFLFFYQSAIEKAAFSQTEIVQKSSIVQEIAPGVIWIKF